MRNPPVTNALPATQAPASPVQGSAADQPAESFGSVLARQQTASEEPADSGQAPPAHAARATGDSETTGSAPEKISDISDEMLAALLPDTGGLPRTAGGSDNTGSPTPVPGTGDILPADATTIQLPVAATALPYTAPLAQAVPLAQAAPVSSGDMPPSPLLSRARDDSAAPFGGLPTGSPTVTTSLPGQETAGFDTLQTALLAGGARTSALLAQPDAAAFTTLNATPLYSADPTASGQVGAVQLRLNTPLTNRSWGEDLGQKIIWMVTREVQTAELHLNPPLLGPLDIVLSVSGDQASALFASPHSSVRLAVEQALPKLREMLADNGITLGNTTVGDHLPENRQGGTENRQQGRGGLPVSADGAPSSGISPNGLTVLPGRRHEGMVDIFA